MTTFTLFRDKTKQKIIKREKLNNIEFENLVKNRNFGQNGNLD